MYNVQHLVVPIDSLVSDQVIHALAEPIMCEFIIKSYLASSFILSLDIESLTCFRDTFYINSRIIPFFDIGCLKTFENPNRPE